MTFKNALEEAHKRFPNNGQFALLSGESIDEVLRAKRIPKALGVYVIFRLDVLERPLYIGRAGTMMTDGSWKQQGLDKRLRMKQEGVFRRDFFRTLMEKNCLDGLTFFWFVTHDKESKIIPAFAEMELLQAHYNEFGRLPELNRCV